jgi:hypothetical protein
LGTIKEHEMTIKAVSETVRRILTMDWDPIGVSAQPGAQDEYAVYVPKIVELATGNVTTEELTAHLLKIAKDDMGLVGDRSRAFAASAKILSAFSANGPRTS